MRTHAHATPSKRREAVRLLAVPFVAIPLPLVAIAIAGGAFAPAFAWPISPVTLWDLVAASDLVLVAEVIEIVEVEPEESATSLPEDVPSASWIRGPETIARLRVRETWKGEAPAIIEVPFPRNLLCPAPPRYVEGKTVLAFLHHEGDRLETTGLSYGTLYPRGDEIDDLRSLIEEAAALQRLPSGADAYRRA